MLCYPILVYEYTNIIQLISSEPNSDSMCMTHIFLLYTRKISNKIVEK